MELEDRIWTQRETCSKTLLISKQRSFIYFFRVRIYNQKYSNFLSFLRWIKNNSSITEKIKKEKEIEILEKMTKKLYLNEKYKNNEIFIKYFI